MGSNQSKTSRAGPSSGTEQTRRNIPVPNVQFRVLVLGRANAGKTTILQRVCETTESPKVYRGGEEVVRGPDLCPGVWSHCQVTPGQTWAVNQCLWFSVLLVVCPWIWSQRGEHNIDDELVFSNHKGYVFHDSRGIESGGKEEVEILKEFIHRKCGETRLGRKLHAIWFGRLDSHFHDRNNWWSRF